MEMIEIKQSKYERKAMKNYPKIIRTLSYAFAVGAMIFTFGVLAEADAQSGRDPFAQAPYAKPKVVAPRPDSTSSSPGGPAVNKGPMVVSAPPIEARIDYYKRVRQQAAANGQPIPKVTSVLLLDEMSVIGIFRTPRGMAAMVEATPIQLSYTIYPGEKFFDGQLVAVEENRLVFRKVTKWSHGKFVASVENKALREYSMQQDIQGTTPPGEAYPARPQRASSDSGDNKSTTPGVIVSPLEEMNSQPKDGEEAEAAKKKGSKKKAVSKKQGRSN